MRSPAHISSIPLLLAVALPIAGGASVEPQDPIMAWRLRASDLRDGFLGATAGPDLRISGDPSGTDGPRGGSLFFDGQDDRAVVADSLNQVAALLPRAELTVSAWLSVNTAPDYGGIFSVLQDNGGFEKGWVLGYGKKHFYLALSSEGANDGDGVMTYLSGQSSFELGRMYHIVGTYDGKTMCLYVNGQLDGSSDVQSGDILYPEQAPVVLGGYRDDNEDFRHHGRIREVALYDRAMSKGWVRSRFRKDRRLAEADPLLPAATQSAAELDPAHVQGQDWGPWHVIGPFEHEAGPLDMVPPTPVESYLSRMSAGMPVVKFNKDHRGRWGRVGWEEVRGVAIPHALDVGIINFNALLQPEKPQATWNSLCSGYLYRVLEMEEAGTIDLQMGSDDGLRFWLNGQLIVEGAAARVLSATDHVVTLRLSAGTNHLLVKVVNSGGAWAFQMKPWTGVPYKAVNAAIDRGVKFMINRQFIDGSWGQNSNYGAGHTAYAVYTLLKSGLSPKHPTIRRAMGYVRSRPADHTYSLSCRILALTTLHAEQDVELLETDVARLLDFQEGTGLYAYPIHPGGSVLPNDLSCTLFATLALRAALLHGMEVPSRTWRRLISGTLTCQGSEESWDHPVKGRIRTAPFGYRPGEGYRGSMTSSGVSILHIAKGILGDRLESNIARKVDLGIDGGLNWIEKHMTWGQNPGGGHHYFHIYGMERVGSLMDERILGGVDWYATGADYLLRVQNPDDGSWYGDSTLVDTLLALLFLERATAPSTGAKRDPDENLHLAEPVDTGVRFRVLAKTPTVVWVTGFGAKTLADLEWVHEKGRGPRVRYAEFLVQEPGEAEERMVKRVEVDSSKPLGAQRLSAQMDLMKTGMHRFRVRVCALLEPLESDLEPDPTTVESPILQLPLEGGFPPAAFLYALDGEQNLLPRTEPTVEASSQYGNGYEPVRATDGLYETRWECAANDKNPTFKIHLRRSVRVGRLLFSHAWPRPNEKNLARVSRFEVILNGRDTHVVEMDPHVLRKTELRLDGPAKVRDIEVRILAARDGAVGTHKLGFSEIELLK